MLKIAMFDEVNESTAMFKLAARREAAPDQGYWLTLDADGFTLPSDWYLRLAGEISRGFHGQTTLSAAMPADPGPPYAGESALAAVHGASMRAGPVAPDAIATIYGERLQTGGDALLTVIDSSGAARVSTVLYSSPDQWNVVVPEGTASGPATLVAERDGLLASGPLAYGRVDIQPVAPGIFTASASGGGPPIGVVRVEQPDGTVATAAVAVCDGDGVCRAAPIELGPPGSQVTLELYGTGIRGRSSLDAVTCTIGGENAPVLRAGPDADRLGVDQVQISLPRSLAGRGLVGIRVSVDGVEGNVTEVVVR
ncbi:MAG: hypothetical protein JNL98_38335 [Bryobacterales bacterium]|nr:hypothetical protein [Bryobacterales bacterium]